MTQRQACQRAHVALVVLLATASVAGGCGSDGAPQSSPAATGRSASASPSLSVREQAERDAIAAYNALWQATAKAAETANPDAPELREYAAGDALALVVGTLVGYQETGVVTRGRPVNKPRVVSAVPSDAPVEVRLVDCGDDRAWRKYSKNGALVDKDPGGFRKITATVKRVADRWKVTTFAAGDHGSC